LRIEIYCSEMILNFQQRPSPLKGNFFLLSFIYIIQVRK
jgi:hypothetical protein